MRPLIGSLESGVPDLAERQRADRHDFEVYRIGDAGSFRILP